ncbi:MAG: rRNA maturation RNase YbeY [Bacillota bacterium]|jgi:probable rRNA maturation factor|nr:rRNA maturation RNase YbeY [Bacillota bacterium]HHT90176.1 rRNA maturation RNase YbeY [Bacillota bacterium]
MDVLINSELDGDVVHPYENLVRQGLECAAQLHDLQGTLEVSVSFVDDGTIQILNREYRSMDAPTDVLSFPQDDDGGFVALEGMPAVLGDIVISLERAQSQAAEFGHSVEREVVYLAVHGFLHLLGYDHHDPEEQRIMREQEERVLAQLELGRDYR